MPDLATKFLTHERNLFRRLKIDCAGGYLDYRPKIRLAGDEIPQSGGRAKQLMKNLPRDGYRKSPGEGSDFQRLSAGSGLLKRIPTDTEDQNRLNNEALPNLVLRYSESVCCSS
jgi:hypothetical protein